jgi:hypothetical protein
MDARDPGGMLAGVVSPLGHLLYLGWTLGMTSAAPTPVRTVLTTTRRLGVRALLIHGQACTLYGASGFSRDAIRAGEDALLDDDDFRARAEARFAANESGR